MTPSIFALFVIVPALLATGTRMVTVFMLCCLFGATAALEVTALGGAPITPAVFALPFLAWWALRQAGSQLVLQQLRYPGAGAWLFYLSVWGVVSAAVLPRLLAGETFVYTTSRTGGSLGVSLVALQPNSTNITQTCYALGGLAAFVALRALLERDATLARFRDAAIALAATNVLAATINLIEEYAHVPLGLELVRNANYAVFGGYEVAGLIRIQGTFAETSAFSSFTAPLMACMASLWLSGQRPRWTGPLALASLLLLAFSTSTTAYASLLVYGALLLAAAAWRLLAQMRAVRLGAPFAVLWVVLVAACVVLLAKPELFDRMRDFFEVTVWRKLESSSGVERSEWNAQAWRNFLDTYGVGVGLGSARASSFSMVLLSNLGVIGVVLFAGFLWQVFRGAFWSPMPERQPVARAAGHAVLVTLITASISGTVFDIGMAFYAYCAAAAAGAATAVARSPATWGQSAHA